jgi:hypothetical protein
VKRCRSLFAALCAVAGLLPPLPAVAQADPGPAATAAATSASDAPAPVSEEAQQLYSDALQSIADGRKNDASATLSRVIEHEPLHAGAWLDLALIQCALGHAEEAERLFAIIEVRFAPPQEIIELIASTRQAGCAVWQPLSQGTLSLGRGITQNANQGSSRETFEASLDGVPVELPLLEEFLPRHDQFTTVAGDYYRDLNANGTTGFAQFQARQYDSLHEYNSASLLVGVDTPWRFGRWTLRGSAMVGLTTLDGSLYQRLLQLQMRVGVPLPLSSRYQFSVTGGVNHANYLTLSNFDSNTVELRGQFSYRKDDRFGYASVSALSDHAIGDRPGGNRTGWMGTLQWRQAVGYNVTGELGYTQQEWNGKEAYSPGFINVARRQSNRTLRAALQYPVAKGQVVVLEGRQIRNHENISFFQYNDRQLQLSWQWQLP